jgi:hypothetical protein
MKPIAIAFREKDLLSFNSHLLPLRSLSRHNKAATRRTLPNEYFFAAIPQKNL